MFRVLAKDETPSGGAVSSTEPSSGASKSVAAKFRLWRVAKVLHLEYIFPYDLEFDKSYPSVTEAKDGLCATLGAFGFSGTPDYDIADNTDPDKVFTVYAREEK